MKTLEQLAAHFEASAQRWRDHADGTSEAAERSKVRAETFDYCARELRQIIGERPWVARIEAEIAALHRRLAGEYQEYQGP